MWTYLLRRLLGLIPLLLVISLVTFFLVRLAPGSPFDKERAPASPEIERTLKAKFHLDEPLWKQYLRYLGVLRVPDGQGGTKWCEGGLIKGDLGPSLKYRNHTVNDLIAQGLPVSMSLGICAFLFAMGVGIPLGFYSAAKRGQWQDHAGSFLALLAFCIPGLVVAPLLIMVFSIKLGWFPVGLWETPVHMVLPTVALGLYFAGRTSRLMREGMTEALKEGHITTARAKGLSESAVLWKHAFRLGVLPVLSYSGPLLADLLTGSFVVESVFRVPGIGAFLVYASLGRDYLLVVGLAILYAFLLVVLNLLVDIAYGWLDPRVRYS